MQRGTRRRQARGGSPLPASMRCRASCPAALRPAAPLVVALLGASLGLAIPADTHAQTVAERPVPPMVALLTPTHAERLFCSRVYAEDAWAIQRRGDGWYRPGLAWDENFPRHFRIEMTSQRSITLTLDGMQQPRLLQVRAPRPDSLGGGTDAVTIRFLPGGAVQDGYRSIRPSRRGRTLVARDLREQPLRAEDQVLGYATAVELSFRCVHGLTEPLPEGWIWTLVRRPL